MTNNKPIIAAIQMASATDKKANLATAAKLVAQAAKQEAMLVVLPEFFNYLGRLEDAVTLAETIPGPASEACSQMAAENKVWLVAGSICEKIAGSKKGYNTCLVFNPKGDEVARYRKVHLFNVDMPGELSFHESEWIQPGEEITTVETPFGLLGIATCYDLRFPELFRRLASQGMDLLAIPSAFLETTGQAHWEILVRARAIENQAFTIAANQADPTRPNFATHGHSMLIDAWGKVLGNAKHKREGVLLAEFDRKEQKAIRQRLPAIENRQEWLS